MKAAWLACLMLLAGCYQTVRPEDVECATMKCYPPGHPELIVVWSKELGVTFPIEGGIVQVTGDVPIDLECSIEPKDACDPATVRALVGGTVTYSPRRSL